MPPKCKFTREEIIQTALDIARNEGANAITARALGAKLGASSKPIFGAFAGMDEVQQEIVAAARKLYNTYVDDGLKQTKMPAFKCVGLQYIKFAVEESKLFQMLFMSEQSKKPTVANVLPVIDDNYSMILKSVQKSYDLREAEAEKLYRHLWVYTHGIAVLCATNMCTFTGKQIGNMITEVCASILKKLREDRDND